MESTQDDLRARIRDGDPDAFGTLFDRYADAVCNHAFHLVGDWSAAEDVMSTAFLEAWRLRHRIDPEGGSLRPWLLGIATNLARNHVRATHRRRRLAERLPGYIQRTVPDIADDAVHNAETDALVRATRRALRRLKPDERELVALCVWSELSYEEAAEALGVPIGTVRSRMSRARAKIRRWVAEDAPKAGAREPDARTGQLTSSRTDATRTRREATR